MLYSPANPEAKHPRAVTTQNRREAHSGVEEPLRHESLLAEVSSRFTDLAADQIDAAIEDTQRFICGQLGLDRSTLFQLCDWEPGVLLLTHLHQPADGPPSEKRPAPSPLSSSYWALADTTPPAYARLDARVIFPWVYEQLQQNHTIVICRLDDLPSEAAADKAALIQYQTRSTVIVPLYIGTTWLGCLGFASMREQKNWSAQQVRRFQFIADVFASALARRRAEYALCEVNERLQLATQAAGVGLWRMDVHTPRIWVTDRTREILGLAPGEALTDESFYAVIHPDDYAAVRQTLKHATEHCADVHVDYRVTLPDGGLRWVMVHGRPYRNALGETDHLMGIVLDVTEHKRAHAELLRTADELKQLQDQLQQESPCLQDQVKGQRDRTPIVGNSDGLLEVIRQAERVATTDSTVLILGETGTGKELLAQYIHRISRRSANAFVTTNVAAIPSTLLESELFGREKGAYTGALTREIGRFQMADGGTLFLDEIGEMPMEIQAKLLRVLQTGEFERLGSGRTLHVDVRVIAATNRRLPDAVGAGTFRQDLLYRLNVFPITLPPLRQRREDIPLLVWTFVRELSQKMGRAFERIRKRDLDALQSYDWPGNVRELRNVVERSMILAEGPELRLMLPDGRPGGAGGEAGFSRLLADVERHHITEVLESVQGRIRGTGGAAEILGLKPTTLYSLMARLGIDHHVKRRGIVGASAGRCPPA